jgi:hypothetical protein
MNLCAQCEAECRGKYCSQRCVGLKLWADGKGRLPGDQSANPRYKRGMDELAAKRKARRKP